MEQYFYAQLDEHGRCFCLSQLSGEVNAPGMLRISEEDFKTSPLGRTYVDGAWYDTEDLQ